MHETISILPKERIPKMFKFSKKQHLHRPGLLGKQANWIQSLSFYFLNHIFFKGKETKKEENPRRQKNGNRDRTWEKQSQEAGRLSGNWPPVPKKTILSLLNRIYQGASWRPPYCPLKFSGNGSKKFFLKGRSRGWNRKMSWRSK